MPTSVVYNRLHDANAVLEDASDAVELRSRSNLSAEPSGRTAGGLSELQTVIEVTLQPDDTLQKISLLYRASVSELKRLNNFITEQDFYSRKTLRVPVSKFGSHFDSELPSTSSHTVSTTTAALIDLDHSPFHHPVRQRTLSAEQDDDGCSSNDSTLNPRRFLSKVDSSLAHVKTRQERNGNESSLDDEEDYRDELDPGFTHRNNSPTSAWHSSLRHYILTMLFMFIIIVLPLAFVIYFTAAPPSNTPHHNHEDE